MIYIRSVLAIALFASLPNALAQLPDEGAKRPRMPLRTCVATPDPNSSTGRAVQCTESAEPTDARDIALRKCHDEARPHRGTHQWAEHMKACVERVVEEHRPR